MDRAIQFIADSKQIAPSKPFFMTSEITIFFIAFAVLLFFFGLVSRKISDTVVTAPMIFVAAGMLLSPEGLDLVNLSSSSTFILNLAELALVLTLFSDASKIDLQALLHEGTWTAAKTRRGI